MKGNDNYHTDLVVIYYLKNARWRNTFPKMSMARQN